MKVVSSGYNPRPLQAYLHSRLKRFNVLIMHRRFGKTVFSINELIDRLLRNPRKNPQAAYIAPTYGAAKRIAWTYFKEFTGDIPGIQYHEGELKVTIQRPGSKDFATIYLLGAENPAALKGIYLDFAIIDEYAECDPMIWTQIIRPALSDRNGGAIFIFTPKGANHAYEIFKAAQRDTSGEWFACMLRASDTNIIPLKELEAAKATMGEAEYLQEFECDFTSALVGAYYKHEMSQMHKEKRVTRVPYDTHTFVTTAWDLGVDDSTAIWFIQECGRELHVIDYWEGHGLGFPDIVKMLLEKPYSYGAHILPFDVQVKELGTGKTRLEILKEKFKLKNIIVAPKLRIEDGIAAVRSILPRMWMDVDGCAQGIEGLKAYERQYNAKDNVFKATPKHNFASHPADAMRVFATGFRLAEDRIDDSNLERQANVDYDVLGW
jgi:hypothetical protein